MIENNTSKIRPIAFYLPQFHPIPENDKWWGKGFTEWTNVAKSKPLFKGHYQPRLPTEMGFYDLRVPEIREQQVELAKKFGIYGFCYYHYWSEGRRLLDRPFKEIFSSGQPNFPFCLCWANENWTRRWDGQDQDILWQMRYSDEDDINHMEWLCNVFKDSRYIKIDNKPLFLVYRTCNLPNPNRTASLWRKVAKKNGIKDILLCNVESLNPCRIDPEKIDFDVSVEFQPIWDELPNSFCGRSSVVYRMLNKIRIKLRSKELFYYRNRIVDYETYVNFQMKRRSFTYPKIPCVFPSWDNSPRKGDNQSIIFKNSHPTLFGKWVANTIANYALKTNDGNKYYFINAWNEWAEGCYLEPCQKWGYDNLRAVENAINKANNHI